MAFLPSWLGGGGTTVDNSGQVVPLGGGLGMNSLIGLGFGLMSGTRNDPYGNAMTGFAAGSRADMDAAYRQQLLADRAADRKRQAERDAILDKRYEAEQTESRRRWDADRESKPSVVFQEGVPYLVDPRDRTQPVRPIDLPGSQQSDSILMPDGSVARRPEGADRKAWRNEMTKIAADAQGGKMTEEQAKSAAYAGRMEMAQMALGNEGDVQGLSQKGKALESVPWGLGRYGQTNDYQNFSNAKEAFLTAHLRRESGAAIHDPEYQRAEKTFFPQPGEGEQQVNAKRKMRAEAIRQMKASAGMGYKSPSGAANGGGQGGDPLVEARDAIKRGADPNQVKTRLLKMGIDPRGL